MEITLCCRAQLLLLGLFHFGQDQKLLFTHVSSYSPRLCNCVSAVEIRVRSTSHTAPTPCTHSFCQLGQLRLCNLKRGAKKKTAKVSGNVKLLNSRIFPVAVFSPVSNSLEIHHWQLFLTRACVQLLFKFTAVCHEPVNEFRSRSDGTGFKWINDPITIWTRLTSEWKVTSWSDLTTK